jgi:hypothetical protein
MATIEHALKHPVWITLAARRTQSVFIIDPRKDDDPGLRVEPEKQSKPPPDFGAPPMSKRRPHRVSLPVLFPVRVTGHDIKDQFRQAGEEPDVGVGLKALRVLLPRPLCGRLQFLQLLG